MNENVFNQTLKTIMYLPDNNKEKREIFISFPGLIKYTVYTIYIYIILCIYIKYYTFMYIIYISGESSDGVVSFLLVVLRKNIYQI